jgi:hypothetical protein
VTATWVASSLLTADGLSDPLDAYSDPALGPLTNSSGFATDGSSGASAATWKDGKLGAPPSR